MHVFLSKWPRVAGLLLIGGALAWTLKLGVIISTNGRIIDTGPAALFMKIGLILFVVGSTGIGTRLSLNRPLSLRLVAIILSPVIVFGILVLIGTFTSPLFKHSSVWYAQQEGPIGIAVIVYLIIGYFLYRSYKPITP